MSKDTDTTIDHPEPLTDLQLRDLRYWLDSGIYGLHTAIAYLAQLALDPSHAGDGTMRDFTLERVLYSLDSLEAANIAFGWGRTNR